jgi:hypothetical protein
MQKVGSSKRDEVSHARSTVEERPFKGRAKWQNQEGLQRVREN